MYLLDTCTLLWLAADSEELPQQVRELLVTNGGMIFCSAISGLEIAIKVRQKKLKLPLPTAQWFPQVLAHHGVADIALSAEAAILSGELPLIHNDPFDRLIIATALTNGMSIITPDSVIAEYPQVETIWSAELTT